MTTNSSSPAPLWDARSTAKYLHLSPRTLERMRADGDGPKYIKLNRKCLYHPEDIKKWVRQRTVTDTADATRRLNEDDNTDAPDT